MDSASPPRSPVRRETVADGAVVLAVVGIAWVLPLFLPHGEPEADRLIGTVGFVLVAALLNVAGRRRIGAHLALAGVAAVAVTVSALVAPGWFATADDPTNLMMTLAPVFPTYAAHLHVRDRRTAWIVTGLLTAIAVRPWSGSVTVAADGLLYVCAPMLFGLYLAARQTLVLTLTERAERAERERDLRTERARTEERVRLATDLHDIVTHRISLMVLHAGALRITATDGGTRAAAEKVRATGCTALEELRDLIGVLRKSNPRAPEPPAHDHVPAGARVDRTPRPRIDRSDVRVAVIATVATFLATVALVAWTPVGGRPDWTVPGTWVAVQLPVAAALLLRRRHPQLVLGVAIASTLVMIGLALAGPAAELVTSDSATLLVPVVTPLATYAAAAYTRRPVAGGVLILTLLVLAARPWAPHMSVVTVAAVFVGVPALLGMYVGARRRLIAALTERAARAEREQWLLADRARAGERARLAQEMHDIVARRVLYMLDLADGLGADTPSASTRDAAGELAANGRQALDELQELVGALRSNADSPVRARVDSDGGLARLVAESASVGVPVDLVEEGDPAALSPTVARTAQRIVGESLTNVRKHAHGARVEVRVRYSADGVRIAVRNGPPPPASALTHRPDPELAAGGSGTGLLGVRGRVDLVNGTFEAGPTGDGGFSVDATLPGYVPTPIPTPEEPSR